MTIDTTLDFRTECPGKDPDAYSPTLRRYHSLLWSKPLPSGEPFTVNPNDKHKCLQHRADTREIWLSSDSIIASFSYLEKMRPIFSQFPAELKQFETTGSTIGGRIVFPAVRIDRKPTINGARGMHPRIRDRFDLTLECIRRHYDGGGPNPLQNVLARYGDFFALFQDFRGYVDFFLLQDLVNDDYEQVRFFLPFDDFTSAPAPQSVESYRGFMERSMAFVTARNERIRSDVHVGGAVAIS
jgi:hypothetical protein